MPFTACLLLYFKKEEENSTWIKFDPVILHLHITCITTPTNYSHQHPRKKKKSDIRNISILGSLCGTSLLINPLKNPYSGTPFYVPGLTG
jgi:hypothetical protein